MIAAYTRTLREFLDREFLPRQLGVSDGTRRLWKIVVNRIDGWNGEPLLLDDLTDETVLRHLTAFLDGRSPVTVNNQRRRLLQLWNAAHEAGYCDPPRRNIPRVQEYDPEPEAWTVEEFSRILAVCRTLKSRPRLTWRAIWWESIWSTCYWTGARIGALLAASLDDWNSVRMELRLRASAAKNHRGQRFRLPPSVAELIACGLSAAPHRSLLWPWSFQRKWLFREARKIVTLAGVPCPVGESRQLFHRAKTDT